MSDIKNPNGLQVDTINRNSPFVQTSFDLNKQDSFATSFAVEFQHFKAMSSPIGKSDRGDYRRNDGVDTITSNGMLYFCAGKFSATMTDNSRQKSRDDGGQLDPSQSRIVMPRYYNDLNGVLDPTNTIYLAPGDRIYVADKNTDVKVPNYHEMDYEADVDNVPMFPIDKLEFLVDNKNIQYACGVDFKINQNGNIVWIAGGRNPGINADTGKGNPYSVRYLYRAYWYVQSLPKEVRITNVTTGTTRSPERMAQNAILVREFVYHNQNRGNEQNQNKPKIPSRVDAKPQTNINPDKFTIPVDMNTITEDEG